ncbi:hypothetical protein CDD82_6759 [Ophiocordyceps australis]|uniref:Uncharacterized protein n=1 Tax=Ophiocordyceps australis TaxID=1399860 RepID=A0A2C5YVZ6_9HYPO|nr:hypothetical protein CDD82_6759 [Ophiocordyceps australis]
MKLSAVVGLSFVLVAHALPGRYPRDHGIDESVGVEAKARNSEWDHDAQYYHDSEHHENEHHYDNEHHLDHSADSDDVDDSHHDGDPVIPVDPGYYDDSDIYDAAEWNNHHTKPHAVEPPSAQLRANVAYNSQTTRPVIRRSPNPQDDDEDEVNDNPESTDSQGGHSHVTRYNHLGPWSASDSDSSAPDRPMLRRSPNPQDDDEDEVNDNPESTDSQARGSHATRNNNMHPWSASDSNSAPDRPVV